MDKEYLTKRLSSYEKQLDDAMKQEQQWKIRAIKLDGMITEIKLQLLDLKKEEDKKHDTSKNKS